ncbi:translocation/assembly module TamB domain-containing protein [bacterium]|nr:translocation/assembly module TamB domain-containing protein [bacterium]
MRVAAKRIITVITILLLLPVVLVVGALIYLTLPPGENFIREQAQTRLADLTGLDIQIGDLETNLFSSTTLFDVHVRHREIATDQDLVAFSRLKVQYDLLPLMNKWIRVDSLAVDSLAAHLLKTPDGRLNLPEFPADTTAPDTAAAPFPYEISLGGARVHLAEATYRDEELPLDARLDSLVLHARGYLGGRYDYELLWDQAKVDTDGRELLVQDFMMNGHLVDEQLQVDSLKLVVPGAELAGEGSGEIVAGEDSTQSFEAGVRLNADLASLSRQFGDLLPDAVKPLRGALLLDATVDGSASDPVFVVNLRGHRIRAGEYRVNDLKLGARGSLSEVTLDELHVETFGGNIDATGAITLDSLMQHNLTLRLTGIDMAQLQQTFMPQPDPTQTDSSAGLQRIEGTVGGQLTSSGPLSQPWSLQADASLAANVQEPRGLVAEYALDVNYSNHQGSVTFRRGETVINAEASINTNAVDGSFKMDVPRLVELAGPLGVEGLTGSLSGNGRFRGNMKNPLITATVSSSGITYQNFPVDSLLADVSFDSSGLVVNESHLSGEIAPIDSSAAPFGLSDLHGSFRYQGAVSGKVPDLRGSVEIQGEALGYGDVVTDSLEARVRMRNQRVELTKLQVFRDERWITLQGNYDLENADGELALWFSSERRDRGDDEDDEDAKPSVTQDSTSQQLRFGQQGDGRLRLEFALLDSQQFRVTGKGGRINLADLPRVHPGISGVSGMLAANLSFEGSATNPHGRLELILDSLRAADFTVDTLRATVDLDTARVQTDLRLILQQSSPLTASVTLPLDRTATGLAVSETRKLSAEVVGDDVDIAFLNQVMPEGLSVGGLLSISYHASGTLTRPLILGEISVDSARVDLGEGNPSIDGITIRVTQYDTVLTIEKINATALDHYFQIDGEATLHDMREVSAHTALKVDNRVAMRLEANYAQDGYRAELDLPGLPLNMAQQLSPDITDFQGVLSGRATVEGDTGLPRIKGELKGRGIRFKMNQMNDVLYNGNFQLSLDNESVVIDTLHARYGDDGKIIVDGRVDLKEDYPFFALRVRGTNIHYEQEDLEVSLDGMTLNFNTNEQNRHVISGDIRLGETRYTRDYRIDTIMRSLDAQPVRQIRKPNEIAENIELNVRLREADNLWVDNNLAKIRMDANIGVIGTISDPIITGRVSLDEGYVMYLDRKFSIQEGVIDFVDTRDINPYLNIIATSRVIDYDQGEQYEYNITLMITGNAKSAKIELTSDPYLEQSSILSLLTFGTPHAGDTGIGSQAGSLAGRAVSSYVGSRVGSAFGLEQVSVQGNLFAPEESGATLLATKEISNRAEITYITNVDGFNENSIRISYFLSKNWTITGETNQEGEGSVDLKLKVRWNEIRWK